MSFQLVLFGRLSNWPKLFGSLVILTSSLFLFLQNVNAQVESELVSVNAAGIESKGVGGLASLSSNGRYVAFVSYAENVVAGETSEFGDVFVRDRLSKTTECISLGINGGLSNGHSLRPSISGDGRYVAFESTASNLVPNDTNNKADVFVKDRLTGDTILVSQSESAVLGDNASVGPTISSDGRYVAFATRASNLIPQTIPPTSQIVVKDLITGSVELVSVAVDGSPGNAGSFGPPAASADFRYIGFASNASNLVPNDTNAGHDFFLRDRVTAQTVRISLTSAGEESHGVLLSDELRRRLSISSNGNVVAFESGTRDLVENDTNNAGDIFVHELNTGRTIRVSLSYSGNELPFDSEEPFVTSDGRYVLFTSSATNLVRSGDPNSPSSTYIYDRVTNDTTVLATANDGRNAYSHFPAVSADGMVVAFAARSGFPLSNKFPGATTFDLYAQTFRCSSNSTKIIAGTCGCNVSDQDVDHDGIPNCLDSCPTDSRKVLPGLCGCNYLEPDLNFDGQVECIAATDGSGGTSNGKRIIMLSPARIVLGEKGVIVNLPVFNPPISKLKYVVKIIRKGQARTITSKKPKVVVKDLPVGSYKVSYSIQTPDLSIVQDQTNSVTRFNIRKKGIKR